VPQAPQSVWNALATSGLPGFPEADARGRTAETKVVRAGEPLAGEKGELAAEHGNDGSIDMPVARIEAAKITVAPVTAGSLARRITVPGVIAPDIDRLAHIPAKVVGTVVEMRKRPGDTVKKGEVVAVLDSREAADAKSEYLTGSVNFDLQKTMFERAQTLWDKKISAEQQYLQARATFIQARLRADLARQKLLALNLDPGQVAQLPEQETSPPEKSNLRRYEIRSSLSGRVIERKVNIGASVGQEGDPSDLYSVADLSVVWVEMSLPTTELDRVAEGQRVVVSGSEPGKRSEGKVIFVSPVLDQETRSARVIAEIGNADLTWRPGSYVSADIFAGEKPVKLRLPRTALQKVDGKAVVFVRTPEGFEKREVVIGEEDEQAVEVVSGLKQGDEVAVANSFLLKAELGKGETEHGH
jgi:cobalt-zinc-cadmium efflux system membrane fusion protein